MRRIIGAAIALVLSLNIIAQNNNTKSNGSGYCAKMKDGIILVIFHDNPITSDMLLDNGTIIKPDGAIITKDGNRITLKDGECINQDGTMPAKEKNKSK
ncbi:MAG TPA: DUF6799 domain-containing protein [Bacteroidia bacterium]|jgi:hypothetical protein|nr:DUF6799 domain-containing protein [Bacteroidia bacterium]